ncbi:hypothetical protein CRM22_007516 [Opisthorchis felineus]|uniref:BAH domain-containing protein n=1 Tax=Opisthorchis felineus TaxID=147828 RepID=A0A4S2LFR2_OPIFE|nr:hypothetical protein CRM22_007516 [Opisthorchis felineus]
MKRKGKQKKGTQSSTQQVRSKHEENCELEVALSSVESQIRTSTVSSSVARASTNPTCTTSVGTIVKEIVAPVTIKGDGHDRKHKHELLRVDSQCSDSRDADTHLASEHDYADDDVAPELVAMHDLSLPSTSPGSTETRHLADKADSNALNSHRRRLSKREMKAMLKQNKRNRSALDEKLVATMDELALHLKGDCIIDPNPSPLKPVRVAAPPNSTSTTQIMSTPIRRGVGGRRAGRRGGRRGRGGAKLVDIPRPDPLSNLPASWVPLMLPYTSPELDSRPSKPAFLPWLHLLPDTRAHRFATNIRHVLSQHYSAAQPSVRPILDNVPCKDNKHQTFMESVTPPNYLSLASTLSVRPTPVNDAHSLKTPVLSVDRQPKSNPPFAPQPLAELEKQDFQETSSFPPPQQVELRDVVQSATITTPARRPRGRCRGRRGSRLMGYASVRPTAAIGEVQTTVTSSGALINPELRAVAPAVTPKTPLKSGSKPRVSRELRGLVTWDAVIAQQKRQQEQAETVQEHPENAGTKVQHPNDLTTAVAQDLLAQAALEQNNLSTSRTRRTRQSSGSVLSQAAQSTHHSETASVVTTTAASELTVSELRFLTKRSDFSSIARSESSSIVSDVVTTPPRLSGLDQLAEETKANRSLSRSRSSPVSQYAEKPGPPTKETVADSVIETHTPTSQRLSPLNDPTPYVAKYSPISVDHEPEPNLDLPSPNIPSSSTVVESSKRGRSKSRRDNKAHILPAEFKGAAADLRSYSAHKQSTERFPASSPSPHASSLPSKRRRQNATPTLPHGHISPEFASSRGAGSVAPAMSEESVPVPAATSGSGSLRRYASSRTSALPPRKRYKAGIDSPVVANDEDPTTAAFATDASQNEVDVVAASDTLSIPTPPATHIDVSVESSKGELSAQLTPATASIPRGYKRGRGRPSRRAGITAGSRLPGLLLVTATSTASPPAISPTDTQLSAGTMERPKREAAAIGFASLVAANLNNNSTTITTLDSPASRSQGNETPTARVADVSVDGVPPVTLPPPTPRGRGRPPKPKPTPQPPSSVALTTDTDVSKPSELPSSVGRRKRPAAVLSPSGRNIKQAHLASTTPTTPNAVPKELEERTSPSSTFRRHVEQPSASILPSADSGLPAASPDVPQPTTPRKVGRPRSNKVPETPVRKLINPVSIPQTSPDSSTIQLPSRISLFKGHLLTDPISLGMNSVASTKGPVCDIFLRFLNEPDPIEPDSRLCAPFIFLPTPERYPEFYRFVISSYSGTLIRTRFVKSFLSRLFSVEPSNGTVLDEPIFGVEFPSLCLASIARRFVMEAEDSEQLEKLAQDLGLTESELGLISLNPADVENSIPLLDAAVESVLTVWESFAGRRSWLGRRLIRLRALYSTLRSDCARSFAEEYGQFIPPLKATAVLNMPVCKTPGAGVKKKADRRALERGAEVIRCLCGFRVEGGHAMVQCDRCASWQHLPCLWWALNQAINNRRMNRTVGRSGLCQAALVAAQAAGSGYLAELIEPKLSTKSDDTDLPYICPVCLELPDLTLEYPRSLSAAMAMNDLDSVFSLQETTVEGEHEFWSLASVDGRHQIRTDDYAFVNRAWMECVRTSQGILNRADMKSRHLTIDEARVAADAHPITTFYDRVVIRIYRLWKDKSGKPWLEGGLFLRPYDLLVTSEETDGTAATQQRLWHYREVVYDEASRLVLPLSAWSGRCVVLCTSAYRTGRPADLLSSHEADQFLSGYTMVCNPNEPQNNTLEAIKRQAWRNQLFFVCDKLFERATPSGQTTTVRFDEISPGYLKVNMRPYCFLRKPDVTVGRATLPRHFTAAQLLEYDRVPVSEVDAPSEPPIPTSVSFPISSKPKGEKLARVVDWLERKRLLNIKTVSSNQQPIEPPAGPVLSLSTTPHRGRPRGSRGRGRPPRSVSQPVTDLGSEISGQVPTVVVHCDSAAAVHVQPDGVLETADAFTVAEAAVSGQSADSSESRAKKPLRPAEPLQPVTQELPTVSVSATEVSQERLELSAPLSEIVVAPELLGREEPKIEPLPEVVPLEPIPSILKQESEDVISSAASPQATGAGNDNVVVSEDSMKVDNPPTSSDSNTTVIVNSHTTEKRRYAVVTTTTDSMSTTSASARKRKCAVTRKRIASASASVSPQVRETTTFFSDSEVPTEPTLEASTVVYSGNLAEDRFLIPDNTLRESAEAIASSDSEPQPLLHENDRLTDLSFKTAVVCNSPLTAHTPSPESLYEVEVWEGPQLSPTYTATELQENNPLNIPTETLALTEYRIELPASQEQVVGEVSFEASQESSTDGDVCAHTVTSSSVSSPERNTVDVEADFSAVRPNQMMETSQEKPDGPEATVAQTTEVEALVSISSLEETSVSSPQKSLASCERVQSLNTRASLKIGDPTDSQTSCVKEQPDSDTTRKGCTNFSVDCLASDETNPCIRLEERESSSSQPDETPETTCPSLPQPGSNQLSRESHSTKLSASPDAETPCVTTASSVPEAAIHSTNENGADPYLESVVSDSGNDSGATPILDEPAMCGDSSHQPTSSQDIDSFSPTRMMDPSVKGKLPWCEHPTSPVLPERSESTRLQYNHQGSNRQQQHSRSDPPSHRGDRSRNQKAENTSRHSSLASERYSSNHHRSSDPRSTHNRNDRYGSAQSSHPCSGNSSSNSRSNYHGSHRHDRDRDDYRYPFHGHRDRPRSDSDQFHHRYYHKDYPNPNRYESNHGRRSHESLHPKFPRRHDST